MRSALFLLLAACVASCSGAKLKKQQEEIASLQEKAGTLLGQLKERENALEAAQAQAAELDGQVQDLGLKLKAAGARIDALAKSNQDLSGALQAGASQQAAKIQELVAEKDELSRKINELEKDKIAALRDAARFAAQREKYLKASALMRQVKEQAEARLAAAEGKLLAAEDAKAAGDKARSARLVRAREEMGTLADAILKELQSGGAEFAQKGEAIELTIQEALLFKSGEPRLTEAGESLLDRFAGALRTLPPRPLRVEAHSDDAPPKKELFGGYASQRELTAARAAAVVRRLEERGGLEARDLEAVGLGGSRPAKPNKTAAGRSANRRVVLVLEPAP